MGIPSSSFRSYATAFWVLTSNVVDSNIDARFEVERTKRLLHHYQRYIDLLMPEIDALVSQDNKQTVNYFFFHH